MLPTSTKQTIAAALLASRNNFQGSDSKYAASFGLNPAIYNRLKKGETEKVLSEANWIHVARKLNVKTGNEAQWLTAETAVYSYIIGQLTYCQQESTASMYVDKADIGKTHTAREYVRRHKNCIYVDCSQTKTKQRLVRFIAQEFGVDAAGKYTEVYADLVWYLKTINQPMIILDEAGDLDYPAWLELKALWNATEGYCGWYMMGADGLAAKVNRAINNKKVGYSEIFRRYGSKYQRIVPLEKAEREMFMREQSAAILAVNLPTADAQAIIAKCANSLTRLKTEITKLKRTA